MTRESGLKIISKSTFITPLLILFSCLVLLSFGCTRQETPKKVSLYKRAGQVTQANEYLQPNTLWFGFDLRLGPKEEVRIYTPFLKYLERATGKRFRIKFTEQYEDTVDNLGKGVTHFAALGTLNYVIGAKKYGIKYLASGVNKDGDPRYYSMIITRPDSLIQEVEDIRGKCFAFGAEMSTQGHLIPRKMLEDAGINLEDLGRHIYTGSHINAAKVVLNGECDAAGIQDILANRLVSEGKAKVIEISGPYPSSLIAYNSTIDTKIVGAVRSALLAFEPMGRHSDILFDWDKTEMPLGFTEINELELNKVMALAEEFGMMEK